MTELDQQLVTLSTEIVTLRTVINQLGSYVFTKDVAGQYTFANELVCQLFGASMDQIVGKDDSHFFDLDASDELRVNDRVVLDEGKTFMREEANVVKPSGETRIYWSIKSPLRDPLGQIIGLCGISTDITEQRSLEKELQKQRLLVDAVLNNVDAYVYMKSQDGRFRYVNNRFAELLGRSADEIIGHVDDDLSYKDIANQHSDLDRRVFEHQQIVRGEEIFVDRSNHVRHCWSVRVPIALPEQPDALVGLSSDITELYMLKEELRRQAMTDSLTGVSNRRHFFDEANKEFKRSQRYGLTLAVIIIDIDHFKQVNDTYGHQAGDVAICSLADFCRKTMRESDLIGRIGGEEFAILLPDTDLDAAADIADRLCSTFSTQTIRGDWQGEISPTISIGISVLHGTDGSFGALLARADAGLYRAKASGRNRVCTQVCTARKSA